MSVVRNPFLCPSCVSVLESLQDLSFTHTHTIRKGISRNVTSYKEIPGPFFVISSSICYRTCLNCSLVKRKYFWKEMSSTSSTDPIFMLSLFAFSLYPQISGSQMHTHYSHKMQHAYALRITHYVPIDGQINTFRDILVTFLLSRIP